MFLCVHSVQKLHYHFVCNLSFHSPVFLILHTDGQKIHFYNNFHHYLTYRLDMERLYDVNWRLNKHAFFHSDP